MPTYQARFEKYVTEQGDIWDTISLKCYGDEHAMHEMQEANYDYRYVDNFSANVELVVPSTITIENNLRTSAKVLNIKGLLPWR